MCRVDSSLIKARQKDRRAKRAARRKEEHYALIASQFDEEEEEELELELEPPKEQYHHHHHDADEESHAYCLICGALWCEECSFPDTSADNSVAPADSSPVVAQTTTLIVKPRVVEARIVKTRIAVDNLCCELESKLVSRALGPLAQDVIINVIRREIIVTHSCPPNELVDALNTAHLGARLVEASKEHHSDIQQSYARRVTASLPTLVACISVALMGLGVFRFPGVLAALGIAGGLVSLFRALRTLWAQRRLDMNALMCLAIVAALLSRDYTEAAAVTTAFAFAQALQAECLRHVRDILRVDTMPALKPTFFSLKHQTRIESPQIGDIISVRAGDATCHATVRSGTAVCDRSSVTGESVPVIRKAGDTVEEGTLVLDGYLELSVVQPPSHSECTVTAAMDAAASRGKSKQLATKVANIIAPIVIIAAALALVPYTGGKPRFDIALALLVLACPCSLVLAGPLPISAAIAAASKKLGILITSGDALETLNLVDEIATDKTGTLTIGKCLVVEERVLAPKYHDITEAKRLTASLEARSAHPLASAIVAHVMGSGPAHTQIQLSDDVIVDMVERGRGVCGLVDGIQVAVGNEQLVPVPADCFSDPGTVVGVAINNTPVLALLIVDPIRPAAPRIVQRFHSHKKTITMLTGDNTETANSVAKALRIKNVRAQLSPEEKLKYIQDQTRPIAMIGDGANDAQALRAAAVGIAVVRSGVATAAADIVADFEHLPTLFDLAEQATVILKENIALTLLLKICAAAVVLCNYAKVSAAVLADVFSLLIVVANGLRPMSLMCHYDTDPLKDLPDETTVDAPDTRENDEEALCELV